MSFPSITIRDMVAAQTRLIEQLGISQLFGVTGGSMGGMQALVWAAEYPERVRVCVPLATCTSHSAMQIAFNEIGRRAIRSDPHWNEGNYYEGRRPAHGLAVARMVGHVTYLSAFSMTHKFGRKRQGPNVSRMQDAERFAVESYLEHQGESFVERFDPNSYLYLTRALDDFDLFDRGEAAEIVRRIRARFLVISFESDWLYPPAQSRELVRLLKRGNVAVTYINLDTPYGHDSFLIENPPFARIMGHYLDHEYRRKNS
jgi:homoserine O-acetyltransferase